MNFGLRIVIAIALCWFVLAFAAALIADIGVTVATHILSF